jgi:hypothetical protein
VTASVSTSAASPRLGLWELLPFSISLAPPVAPCNISDYRILNYGGPSILHLLLTYGEETTLLGIPEQNRVGHWILPLIDPALAGAIALYRR